MTWQQVGVIVTVLFAIVCVHYGIRLGLIMWPWPFQH